MSAGVKDMALVPAEDIKPASLVQIIERMASDPTVDIDKFERFMAMHERMIANQARSEFFAAFANMQGDIPQITGLTGKVTSGPMNGSTYATNEDVQRIVRPVLQRHGFGLTFRTEFPTPTTVKIIGILGHKGGHVEQTEFVSAADNTGSKNAVQALGSTISYGIRYTSRALLNITSGEVDDDGQRSGKPEPPEDYEKSIDLLSAAAAKGQRAFRTEWDSTYKVRRDICDYILKHDKGKHEGMKAVAQNIDRKVAQ